MQVSISKDFQDQLPPHTPEELEQLEKNCLEDPNHERMPPVQVWANGGNVILDGHNQFHIRQKHELKIRYAIMNFGDRDEALEYALHIQFGRRNVAASQRAILYAKLPRYAHGGDRKSSDQGANLPLDTLAKSARVSRRTMTSAVKVVKKGAATVVEGVRAGDFTASDAAAIADLPQEDQEKIADEAKRDGKTLRKTAEADHKPAENGSSVVSGKEKVIVQRRVGEVIRGLQALGIFDEFNDCLSRILRRVKELE